VRTNPAPVPCSARWVLRCFEIDLKWASIACPWIRFRYRWLGLILKHASVHLTVF
jgi:hypothetical protein